MFVPLFAIAIFFFASLRLDLFAILSVASSAGLLVMVPALMGTFYWKRGTAAGAIISIVVGGTIAAWFQFGGLRPLGIWPGIWSGITATILFIVVSLLTKPPQQKATDFIDFVNDSLDEKKII